MLSHVYVRARPWPGQLEELEAILAAHVAAAREAWPDLELPAEELVLQLARCLPDGAGTDDLRAARAADLFVARAAELGDERAMAAFEARFFGEVDAAANRLRAAPDMAVEVKQLLRRSLFVRDGDRPPAIGTFTGRGDLRGWIRVSAVRALQKLLVKESREVRVDDESMLEHLAPADDPELGYLRERYRRELAEAVAAAIAALPQRERAVLRYHVLDGLNIEEIGKLYGVHRATVARWIAGAREAILARTHEELSRRFGIDPSEVASIIRLVQSRLDVSMERALG